jgi:hypothetical protein
VVVGDVLDSRLEEAGAGNNAQGDESSHDVDFAIRQAVRKRGVSKVYGSKKVEESISYFSPMQERLPLPNARRVFCNL